MSHEGHGHRAPSGTQPGTPGVITFGAANPGDLLADRYRLDEHVDNDAAGRQIWRGTDTVLRRPVALILRHPGGESAEPMLTTAVAASRLVHPHIVSVYDAFDEGERAYLVREWVPGISLRDVLKQAPLDAERTTLVVHAISEAIASLHGAGIVHGNIHPGTILIADDGRVVLTDTHADGPDDAEYDLRSLGAVLYACLTGHWPHAEAGPSSLPDAPRDSTGRLSSPRQVRGGIPRHLDEVCTELLDPNTPPPPANAIAAEFARLATQGGEAEYEDASGPMGFGGETQFTGRRRAGGRMALGIAVLTVIAVVGALIGVKLLGSDGDSATATPPDTTSPSPRTTGGVGGTAITIKPDQVRVVDPPRGDGTELADAGLTVDGNTNTGWSTEDYTQPYFGGPKAGAGLKPGMGLLINLGAPTKIGAVKVDLNQKGASVELRSGTGDPGAGVTDNKQARTADGQIAHDYQLLGQPIEDFDGVVMGFNLPDDTTVQYLLVWLTKLPPKGGRFAVTVNEITVYAAS